MSANDLSRQGAPIVKTVAFVEWSGPDFVYQPKTSNWYALSAIVAVVFIVLGFLTNNFFFVLLVVIAELLVLFWAKEEPTTLTYRIDEHGLTVENKHHPYNDCKWFAFVSDSDPMELVIAKNSIISPQMRLLIDSDDLEIRIREIISDQLPEFRDYEEHLIDTLARIVRF